MKKTLKRLLAVLLCFTVTFGVYSKTAPTEVVEARTIQDVEKEIEEYNKELKKLKAEREKIAGEISSIEDQSSANLDLIKQYQQDIEALELEISINEAIKESYDLKRADVISQIAIYEEDREYRVSMLKKLMQFVYENGDINAFRLLFGSNNLSDFLNRKENLNDIMTAANQLIKDVEKSLAELEILDAELAATQSQYDSYVTELETARLNLDTRIKEFETIAGALNLNKDDLSSKYSNLNSEINKVREKIEELEEEREEMFNSNAEFCWPTDTSVKLRVSSFFGWRKDPINGSKAWHNGIDIATARGTAIYAVRDGIVTRADWFSGYGNCVIIYHGNGISTLYGHCDDGRNGRPTFEVKVGQTVKRGQVIAYVGTTGRSTGYHLHFSVMDNATASNAFSASYIDPYLYLPDIYR
ncbi:MAG: peptidoglycan DD-metalloendopeptidase family protein [Clostridia bacterium]|nr:peptidoglycan DD-metalloendopeptidase family protein [Clostridia bacterium]